MLKKNTKFKHQKGNEYIFLGIVHPSSEKPNDTELPFEPTLELALHTELNMYVKVYSYYNNKTDIMYSNIDEYLVLYQRKSDSSETFDLYARPIQMFFEHVNKDGTWTHRFEQIDNPE